MAVTEDIIVNIREGVSEIKSIVKLREDLVRLKRGGADVGKQIQRVDERLKSFGAAGKGATRVMGQFKFELLGVLFFGMAVNRFLTGLLKPAFEVAGVFEILNDILTIFFLPTAGKVSDALLSISERLSELSPATQEFIGDLVILLSLLGLGLFIFATFGLGLVSVKSAFGLSALAAGLLGLKLLLVGAIIGGFIILLKNWDKVTTGVKALIVGLTVAIGILAVALGAPFIAIVALVIAAFVALKTAYDIAKKAFGTEGFFDTFKAAINVIIRRLNAFINILNRIPGVDIAPIQGLTLGTPADVLAASDKFNPPQGSTAGQIPPSATNITQDLTFNITGITGDFEQIRDEILRSINETSALTLEALDRSR